MPDDASFRGLLRRARSGDATAAAELVQRYEPTIRRTVRFRLANTGLRRLLEERHTFSQERGGKPGSCSA